MGDGQTKPHLVVPEPKKWMARVMKQLSGGEVTGGSVIGVREASCLNGRLAFTLLRQGGSCVVVYGDMSDPLERLTKSEPFRQVLGLRLANGRPLYVAWPDDPKDNRPCVFWGKTKEGPPCDAIDHERLSVWDNALPLYPGWRDGKVCIFRGRDYGKPYDDIVGPISIVGNRELYRARLGKEMLLVWSKQESETYEHVSPPEFDGKEVTAWATRSVRFYKLAIKVA